MAEATALRNNALEYPIYGEPYTVVFPMLDADGDLVTGATTPDSEVSKNGDTFTDCTNEATEIATSSGMYYLSLTATEMTADIVAVISKSATTGMKTTPLVLYPRKLPQIRTGTCAGGDTGYVTLDASASAIDDFYNGCVVSCVIDTVREVRVITDYAGSSKQATVTPAWNTAPDDNDTFIVYSTDMRPFLSGTPVSLGTTAKADVNAEVDTALADINLDHLVKTAKDTDWATTVTKESIIDLMTSKDTSQTYSRTSDSLEAVRDRGDAAWLTGASGASDHAYVHAVGSTGIVIGDVDAGTIANIDVADGTVWSIGEVAGTITYPETAGGQGIRVELTFAGAVGDMPVSVSVWAQYVGSAGHSINVYAYDYVGSGWEYIGNIPNGTAIQLFTYALTYSNIKNDGEMQLMFHHSDGTGVATHYLSLDKVQVNVRHAVTSLSVADIEGSNVLLRSATSGKNQIDADTIALQASLITATDVTGELLSDWKFKMFLQLWYSPQGNSDINIVSGAFSGGNLRFTFITDDIYGVDEGGTDFIVDLQPDGTYTPVSGVDTVNVTYVSVVQNSGTVTISSDLVLEFIDKKGNKFYFRIDAGASSANTTYIRADGTRTSYWASNRSVYGKGANDNPTVLTSVKTVTDALSGTDTELSAIPTTTSSVIDKIKFLFQYFRNKRTITATTETIFKEDASTPLGTSTVSDDGTTFTKGEAG